MNKEQLGKRKRKPLLWGLLGITGIVLGIALLNVNAWIGLGVWCAGVVIVSNSALKMNDINMERHTSGN